MGILVAWWARVDSRLDSAILCEVDSVVDFGLDSDLDSGAWILRWF